MEKGSACSKAKDEKVAEVQTTVKKVVQMSNQLRTVGAPPPNRVYQSEKFNTNISMENPKLNVSGKSKKLNMKERNTKSKLGGIRKGRSRLWFCRICMDTKTREEMFKSSCSHSFCIECIGSHVAAKISDSIVDVKCPDLACKVFFEPNQCRSIVPRRVLDRWEAAIFESLLGPKKFYCPFNDCSAMMVVEEGDQGVTSVECPHCHRLFCAQCRVPWHAGSQCKPVKDDCLDSMFEKLAKEEKWQKCPSCKIHVERTQGCECIRCRCGSKFCYICGSPWSFGHICSTHSFAFPCMIFLFIILSFFTGIFYMLH